MCNGNSTESYARFVGSFFAIISKFWMVGGEFSILLMYSLISRTHTDDPGIIYDTTTFSKSINANTHVPQNQLVKKSLGSFNHRVVTLAAERQCLVSKICFRDQLAGS